MPGAKGASAMEIITTFIKSIKEIRLMERTAAISFNFLMAIPPSLIFLFSLAAFLPLGTVEDTILKSIGLFSPNPKLYKSLEEIILDLTNNKRRELISLGFLFTLFVSSNGVMGILRSFDRESPIQKERTGFARRIKAILLTFGLMLNLILSIGVFVLQSKFLDGYLIDIFGNTLVIRLVSMLFLLLIIYLSISILYRYGPHLQYKPKFFSTGAFLATLLFVLVSYGFFFIANNFINYNKVYGSIGTLLMFMVWIYITSLVILIGYEINLVLLVNHNQEESNEPKHQKSIQ